MDIVVTGYAGLCGSIIIYNDKKLGSKLKERYSESFFGIFGNADIGLCTGDTDYKNDAIHAIDAAAGTRDLSQPAISGCSKLKYNSRTQTGDISLSELDRLYEIYSEAGLAADGSRGGVLAALWRVLKANRLGGMYALRDIPVLQQTVEVCEMYSLNPYRLYAPGCRVWISTDTGAVARAAAAAGVPLNVIGFTSKGAAIRRTDTETDSSLRRPEGDELDKVLPAHSSILL